MISGARHWALLQKNGVPSAIEDNKWMSAWSDQVGYGSTSMIWD
jgi:hypothetical protein